MYMHNLVKLCTTTISEIRPLNNQSAIKPLFGLNRMPPDEILQAGPFKVFERTPSNNQKKVTHQRYPARNSDQVSGKQIRF
ncbi:uncharacterized protein LOC125763160 isoform X2 [Anopheles funestus]|uniref:uncharacterized protein LOC125763160 isoform X2 n=1 Tax=Anopheles funestus TaxID=62324 RepID=UPI0020C6CD58|nr:uncharacterized protein LOC125763160 isoform X2 [Anopheles funestus]